MATKAYVVLRYTGPTHSPKALETWNEAGWKLFAEAWPEWQKAGATHMRTTSDVLGNTPRTMQMIEFGTVEQALACFTLPFAMAMKDRFIALGTLDLSITVHSLGREA